MSPPPPLLYSIPLFAPFVFPVYLLGDSSSFAHGANIYPLSSLVSYQLFSPCCLTHLEGTPQINLHIYIDDINNISHPVFVLSLLPALYLGSPWKKDYMKHHRCSVSQLLSLLLPHNTFKHLLGTITEYISKLSLSLNSLTF